MVLCITGYGAVSSVGLDAKTTCASIRAGLVRPTFVENERVFDLTEFDEVPFTGNIVPEVAEGFSNVGRWLQLIPIAVEDLVHSAQLPRPIDNPSFWRRTSCVFVLPSMNERFLPDPNCNDVQLQTVFLSSLLQRIKDIFDPEQCELETTGRIGMYSVLESSCCRITECSIDRVIIIAVDSLVDSAAIQWFMQQERLKCDMNPAGFSPGEAAAAFIIEGERGLRNYPREKLAIVLANGYAYDPYLEERQSKGQGMADIITQVVKESGVNLPFHGTTICDLNGEPWRAMEFGFAQVRALAYWDCEDTQSPVVATGDVGAATAALHVIIACQSLRRGYARGASVLITTSCDETRCIGVAMISSVK